MQSPRLRAARARLRRLRGRQAVLAGVADPVKPPKPKVSAAAAQEAKPDPNREFYARVRKALNALSHSEGHRRHREAGTVRLWGTVPSAAVRAEAEKIAAAVGGVGSVEIKLVVLKGS